MGVMCSVWPTYRLHVAYCAWCGARCVAVLSSVMEGSVAVLSSVLGLRGLGPDEMRVLCVQDEWYVAI